MFGMDYAVNCNKETTVMKMKKMSLTALSLMFLSMANAQVITQGGNMTISTDAAVTSVAYEAGVANNPGYAVLEKSLDNVLSESFGKISSADDGDDSKPKKKKYGANLITVAPFQFTENGVGFSFGYERTLDKDGMISLYVPVITTFNLSNSGNYNNNVDNPNATMFYVMPGIKIYPTGMGKIRYALGASAVVGIGDKKVDDYTINGYYQPILKSHFLVGMMVNNSLNVNPSEHLYIGLELGLGFTYIDKVNDIKQGANPLVQGAFKVGYRF